MGKYILRRAFVLIPVLFLVTSLNFVLINLAPGDPVAFMLNPDKVPVGSVDYEYQLEKLGLDKPAPVRYAIWLKELAQGSLGYSIIQRRPVNDILLERLGPTLILSASALLLSFVIAIPLGVVTAIKQYSILDYISTATVFLLASVPAFFFALLGIYVFSLRLDLLPIKGMHAIGKTGPLDLLWHLVLPVTILALVQTADMVRYTRSSMLEVIRDDFMRTARSKGLKERVVIMRHALPNVLIPIITLVGLRFPSLLGGAVIIETIFTWPGLGKLAMDATFMRDYPVLMATLLVNAVMVMIGNFLADVAYGVVDPRIRLE